MNKKAKVIAASLCAAQVITMIPLSAAAAELMKFIQKDLIHAFE